MERSHVSGRQSRGMSMREKSERKSFTKELHRNNFEAGHIAIDLHGLTRVGLRGRKAYILMFIFALLGLLAVAELVWTCLILSVLRADTLGLPALSFLRDGGIRFTQPVESSDVVVGEFIGAYQGSNLNINGARDQELHTDASVSILSDHGARNAIPQRSEVSVQQSSGVVISSASAFNLTSQTRAADGTSTSQSYFKVTRTTVVMPVPDRAARLEARLLITPKITSAAGLDLLVTSAADQGIQLTSISGLQAGGQQVTLNSGDSDISLDSRSGITVATVGNFVVDSSAWPIRSDVISSGATVETIVCACRTPTSQTLLFRVPSTSQRCGIPISRLPVGCQ